MGSDKTPLLTCTRFFTNGEPSLAALSGEVSKLTFQRVRWESAAPRPDRGLMWWNVQKITEEIYRENCGFTIICTWDVETLCQIAISVRETWDIWHFKPARVWNHICVYSLKASLISLFLAYTTSNASTQHIFATKHITQNAHAELTLWGSSLKTLLQSFGLTDHGPVKFWVAPVEISYDLAAGICSDVFLRVTWKSLKKIPNEGFCWLDIF